jgi:hypothetical protein
MRIRALILLPFLVCSSFIAAKAQSSTTLQPGVPIERTLGASQVHEFTVNAKANSFVQLVVEQKGIDVVVKISSPDGKDLAQCDTPNGAEGVEQVSFLATEAGKYRIAISPLNKDASGRYQIKLIEAREATEEEIEASKNREAAKAKGIALLLELRDPISQIRSPHTRINAQLTAASLLKETDEKAASKFLLDAVADLKQLLAAASPDEDDVEGTMLEFSSLSQLRNDVIRALAETDPEAALSFLHSTTPKYSPYSGARELATQESVLELSIADEIARKDPNRALQIARQNLKKAYSPSLMNTASQIAAKNPELATELVHDITSKLLAEEKLMTNMEAAGLAMTLTSYYTSSNRKGGPASGNPGGPYPIVMLQQLNPGLLSEQEYKQLVQKMVREVMSYTIPANRPYDTSASALWTIMAGLKALGDELDKIVSGSTAALEKKQTEIAGTYSNQYLNQYQEYQNAIANNPVEAALETIDKAPAELREQLYIMLATREGVNGDLTRAKQILSEHVSNPYQRAQALRSIEQQEIDHAMSSGKIEEALKNISALRTPDERAGQLMQLAGQIGPGQKRATALSLLEQARGMLPPSPQAEDQEQMGALLEIARAFSPYDSKRSFEMIDPLIEQFNDICTAARTLEGFGLQSFDNDELDLNNEGALAQLTNQMSDVLGSLALINFDRAKAASDKLRLAEVRLHVYLQIAEQTITGKE